MKKEISISLLALTLVACGGSSSSSDSTNGINQDFSSDVRGVEQEPALTIANVTEGDSIDLNSKVSGTIAYTTEGYLRNIKLTFSVPENQSIALVLSSSSAADLDIVVTSPNSLRRGSYGINTSNEAVIFDAVAGEIYTIEVQNDTDINQEVDFQLRLVVANRSSLGLSANEYIVEAKHIDSEECVENGKITKYVETTTKTRIFNWKEAYTSRLSKTDKHNFSSIDGDKFSLVYSTKDNEDGETYEYSYNYKYDTNFQTGTLTGSATNKTNITKEDTITETCISTVSITGKVIL